MLQIHSSVEKLSDRWPRASPEGAIAGFEGRCDDDSEITGRPEMHCTISSQDFL